MDREVRHSEKRSAVYRALSASRRHPSAEWLYEKVRREYPSISLGTVYRSLARFKEEGRAVCVGVVGGQERYDADVLPHSHFICRHCGAVIDVHEAEPDENTGFDCGKVESREVIYRGVCKECIEAGNR